MLQPRLGVSRSLFRQRPIAKIVGSIVSLNSLEDLVIDRLFRQSNGVKYRRGLRTAVADNTDPIHSKQQGTAMFGVIHPLPDAPQVWLEESSTDLPPEALGKFFSKDLQHDFPYSLCKFEQYISHKPVADDHVKLSRQDVSPFSIADKRNLRIIFEEEMGFNGELVTLRRFFPNI